MNTRVFTLGLLVAGIVPVVADDDTLAKLQTALQDLQPIMADGFSDESVDDYLQKECANGNQTGCNQLQIRQLSKQFSLPDEVSDAASE